MALCLNIDAAFQHQEDPLSSIEKGQSPHSGVHVKEFFTPNANNANGVHKKICDIRNLITFMKSARNADISTFVKDTQSIERKNIPHYIKAHKLKLQLISLESGFDISLINSFYNLIVAFDNKLNIQFIFKKMGNDERRMNEVWKQLYALDAFNLESVINYIADFTNINNPKLQDLLIIMEALEKSD